MLCVFASRHFLRSTPRSRLIERNLYEKGEKEIKKEEEREEAEKYKEEGDKEGVTKAK